ncbi:hypothetical protein SAMN05444374_11675 [Rhodococcoides kroppenstedtii]|uniref:Uncharacterized protein n=1 Tax=Rhodococcoides kroppenstedtii TaxID=293050 RepID=A0A1I0UAV0_9NOCA|nr:hypothetical protein [Rhodococcus kroppenstedtii]SFA60957.1 hypothetical protein SAMN05444374_11675 [Rhodococcus kroppenstedtii]
MKDTTPAAVLAYHVQGSTVTAELLAAADGSVVGPPAVVTLDDLTAEQIGLSVPSLWRLIDDADVTVTGVVVTGLAADVDAAPPILELALDVPVHRAPSPTVVVDSRGSAPWDRSAPQRLRPARPVPAAPGRRPAEPTRESVPASDASRPGRVASAALTQAGETLPAPPADARPAPADDDARAPDVAGPASSDDVTEAFAVVVDDEPAPVPVSTTDGRRTRRAGTLVAASAAAILVAAGIAGAAVVVGKPGDEPARTASVTDAAPETAQPVADVPAAGTGAAAVPPPAPPAPVVAPTSETAEPDPEATEESWPAPTSPSVPPQTTWSPTPRTSTVPPPVFAVPVPDQDPNKSPQQLQDEAWARHWEQTGEWLNQEFGG